MDMANPESGYMPDTARNEVPTKADEYRDYTLYINPNIYRVIKRA